jgi:hypothetical protein
MELKKEMGRPRKQIDKANFEKLCQIQCTLVEISGFFDCCEDTIENWCKKQYNETFSEIYKKKSANGKISLRRTQFRLAEKNPTMAIWLGKQYLGQKDRDIEQQNEIQRIEIVNDLPRDDENAD